VLDSNSVTFKPVLAEAALLVGKGTYLQANRDKMLLRITLVGNSTLQILDVQNACPYNSLSVKVSDVDYMTKPEWDYLCGRVNFMILSEEEALTSMAELLSITQKHLRLRKPDDHS